MSQPKAPPVTVVIPVRNEEATIASILSALSRQVRADDRVIVVETGSTDHTPRILDEAAQAYPHVSVVHAEGAYPGTARNVGIRSATTEWLALLDAGTRVDEGWLDAMRAPLTGSAHDIDVVIGRWGPRIDDTFGALATLAYVPKLVPDGTRGPTTGIMMVRREAWEKVGGFPDYRAGEDLAFFRRLEEANANFVPAPDARVEWELARGWGATWRRFVSYSGHVLRAGMWRTWHRGTLRNMLLITACLAIGTTLHPLAYVGVPALYALRAGRQSRGKWDEVAHLEQSQVKMFVGVMVFLAVLDLATIWGMVPRPQSPGSR